MSENKNNLWVAVLLTVGGAWIGGLGISVVGHMLSVTPENPMGSGKVWFFSLIGGTLFGGGLGYAIYRLLKKRRQQTVTLSNLSPNEIRIQFRSRIRQMSLAFIGFFAFSFYGISQKETGNTKFTMKYAALSLPFMVWLIFVARCPRCGSFLSEQTLTTSKCSRCGTNLK